MLLLTAIAQPHLFAADTLVSLDTVSQYYPWYVYLGQALRAGHVPGWNAASFSGTPFAANPLSGWTYLPAMLLFAVLPLAQASKAYLLFHPVLAGCATFVFARTLGMSLAGAVLAGLAYANSGFFQVDNLCCFAFASVYAWLPVALLGVELAVCSAAWGQRCAWWGVAGLAVAQTLAAWLGQGAYYAMLLVGAYIAYRTLLVPPAPSRLLTRLTWLCLQGGAVFGVAVALDAAALLPRVEFNALSNLAGGYSGAEAMVGGLQPKDWLVVGTPGSWYAGGSVLALAIAAPVLVRRRLAAPVRFFGLTSVAALILTAPFETPLHWLLYQLLPGFGRLHPHAPERILTVAYLGPSLLAGATLTTLAASGRWRRVRRPLTSLVPALLGFALVLGVASDLASGGAKARADWLLHDPLNGVDKLTPVDLGTYYQADGAAQFLRQRLAEAPSRYLGYAPEVNGMALPYTTRFMDPTTGALEVDNRALPLGLQDVQGYDATHLARYDAYLTALNGVTQNYHDAQVFRAGLSSPLLDLLNVRYVVVPRLDYLDAYDTTALERFPSTAYEDERVRILENPAALPRAWIVHAATRASPGDALTEIASGGVDPRSTALLEETAPPLAQPADADQDLAQVTEDLPDGITVHTSTNAPGMLVLSEVDYPAWQAYVDGQPAHTYVADGMLRAVFIPAGEHRVEQRFESPTLAHGMLISALVLSALVLLWIVVAGVSLEARNKQVPRCPSLPQSA
jgi:hypothetical protein